MDLNAEYRFDAPLAQVWERLMDPATIAGCLPGCRVRWVEREDLEAGMAR